MSGKIRRMIDTIIQERSKGNPVIIEMTKSKFILKGINPDKFDSNSVDDPIIIEKLLHISKEFNVENYVDKKENILSAFSTKSIEEEIVSEIKHELSSCNAKLVIYFASPHLNQNKLSQLMQETFENSTVVGCSSAGEQIDGHLLSHSVVAMALSSNIIADVKHELIDLTEETLDVDQAFLSFEKHFNESSYTMDMSKYVGLILIDGLCMREENLMDLIGNRTNVYFLGGSAGDNLNFTKTYVFADGKVYTNTAALILLKVKDMVQFNVIKTQSFKASNKLLVANKVNENTREVIEFNHKPALLEYANAVGASSLVEAPTYFKKNPVGLMVDSNDIFIRSPQQAKGTSILFYCNILEGMEVQLLEATDIIDDTRKAIEDNIAQYGKIDGILNFDCIQRRLALEEKAIVEEYGSIFSNIPTIGLTTYGEAFIGHMNLTSTMLVFRQKKKHLEEITQQLKEFNILLEEEITERIKVEEALRDTLEKKRMEELQKSIEEERRSINHLKEYDRIKTEFFANISHELRTPINVVFSVLQLYDSSIAGCDCLKASADCKKYMNIMKQNCYRLLRLVNNLLDITKIDSGYFKIQETNNEIVSLIEDITLSVADYIQSKGLSLIFDTDVEEKIIACDPEKIERIVLNLLSNAVKFTPPGGQILVTIENGDDDICVKVVDTGRGIPEDQLHSIFERFVQIDKSLTRDHEGSGIGLSLVKTLVELHGGRIQAKSQLGQGTQMIMFLPCKKVEEPAENISCKIPQEKHHIEKIDIEFSDIYNIH